MQIWAGDIYFRQLAAADILRTSQSDGDALEDIRYLWPDFNCDTKAVSTWPDIVFLGKRRRLSWSKKEVHFAEDDGTFYTIIR